MPDTGAQAARAGGTGTFRVLVVDDDPDMCAYLSRLLEQDGLSAAAVHDGNAALVQAVTSPPDLVLLDVMLPGMSGFEICARLKADPDTALIPIVLVTALEDRDSRVRGIEAGADDFLSKPVHREELIARIKTLRRLHETRRELEARRLAAEIDSRERLRKAFSRYISPRLADRIIGDLGGDSAPFKVHAQRIRAVALFADLRGFTRMTERIEVGEVVGMLNEFFAAITEAAYEHDGTIFSMAGDSLLVGFNVPFPQPDAPARALRTAREMVARFAPLSKAWSERHGVASGVGVGAAAGEAIIGNIGSPHYMSYTIIGDTVNTAARLVQMARSAELLVTETVYRSIRELVPAACVQSRGPVALRGKSDATAVYSIDLGALPPH
jgi:class 3 adenylate cyclase